MNEIIVSQESGKVVCDFEGAKAMLDAKLDTYRKMVFTEDTKNDAKNTVAELRKEKKAFGDRCKEVKKEYMKPLDDFLVKASELSDMFDVPINFINEQIDAFEQKRIEEKKNLILDIYQELIPEEEYQAMIPLSKIYNKKWENATTTKKAISEEIMNVKEALKKALETIRSMNSDMEQKAIDLYLNSFDLSASLIYLNNYEAEKKAIQERERERIRREEEERIRREEREKIEAEQRHAEELAKAVEIAKDEAVAECVEQIREEVYQEVTESFLPEQTGEEEEPYTYTILLSPNTKESLETFMNSIGIEFFCNK